MPTGTLVAEVQAKFEQATCTDSETGQSLPYGIYLPGDYDPSKSYPLVLYIADAGLVGQDVTAGLVDDLKNNCSVDTDRVRG